MKRLISQPIQSNSCMIDEMKDKLFLKRKKLGGGVMWPDSKLHRIPSI